MEILITNDDGWGSKGIITLTRLLTELGHVTVLAPDSARSGMSNAISVEKLIYLHPLQDPNWGTEEWQTKADVYTTNGTPSDCIKLAINLLYEGDEKRINLIASGINHGHNASINLIYSGTMGACFVGAEHNIPSIGYSINDHLPDADFHYFEPYIVPLTRQLMNKFCEGICYNINAPKGELKGVKYTRQCKAHWAREMEERKDDKGNMCYWLVGDFVNHEPQAEDTDVWAIEHGYISIQACTIDMTAYGQI